MSWRPGWFSSTGDSKWEVHQNGENVSLRVLHLKGDPPQQQTNRGKNMNRKAIYPIAFVAAAAALFVSSTPLCVSGADVQSPTNAPSLVGGSPASCGYSWIPDRQGWLGSDGTTFVAAKDKPEWAAYIPAIKAATTVSPIVKPVEPAVAKPVVPLDAAQAKKTKPVVPPATEVHPPVPPGVHVPSVPATK